MLIENNHIEFKAELNDKLEKEVVAFLNSNEGGVIYIGVDDFGHPVYLENIDILQTKITDRIKNNILPATLGLFEVTTEVVEDKTVIKVLISSGLEKPYYIKKYGMSTNGAFIRQGSSSMPMSITMIEELFRKRVRNTLKNIVSPRQDLTFSQLKIYYEEKGFKLNDKFESSLELYTPEGKYNYVAYLLADENSISIKVAKYAGSDKYDLIENEEYGYCSLIKATDRILDKLKIENKTLARITDKKRIQKNIVDATALREAVINAIVHNDYSEELSPVIEIYEDKIVVTLYGGLLSGQTEEDFFSCMSMPRNRELMRVFRDLDLVEQLGSGMTRILKAYDKSIFKITNNYIQVSFPISEITNKDIREALEQDTQNAIADAMFDNPRITVNSLASYFRMSKSTMSRNIKKMQEEGKIERIGSNRNGKWKVNK